MFFLFHSLSVEITQLILTQANFTNAKFDDPNLKLYLIEDINTSKLQMQFNTIELIAELHGNNHTITHNDPQPMFRQIKNNMFNLTLNGYISDLIFFINMDFVTIQQKAFNLVLNSNISHCVFHTELANTIRSSSISDIKLLQNAPIAHLITESNIQNIVFPIQAESFNRTYLLFHQVSNCNLSYILITGPQILLLSEIDQISIIGNGHNVIINNSVIQIDQIRINSNESLVLFDQFDNLTIRNSSFVFNEIIIANVTDWSLIVGSVQNLQINLSLIKIGNISASSQSQSTQFSILFDSNASSTPNLLYENNLFLVNNITYQYQNNIFLLSHSINNSKFVNNTFEINYLQFKNVSFDLNMLANNTENTEFNNTTFIQKQRHIYTNQVDNLTDQSIIMSSLFNNTFNVSAHNLQFVTYQDYFHILVTKGNAKVNNLANLWQNGSLTNVSITVFNKTIYLEQNNSLTGTFQVSGIANVLNNTKLSNISMDVKSFSLLRNMNQSQTNTTVQMTGMGAQLLNTTITNATVNVNFSTLESQYDKNDIAFMLFTIGDDQSTNTINNVYGQVFNVQQNFYYGSFFQGSVNNCYITTPQVNRKPAEKCNNYTTSTMLSSGFKKVQIGSQQLIYLENLLYYISSTTATNFKQYISLNLSTNYHFLYGKAEYLGGNGTIYIRCTENTSLFFTCIPQNYNIQPQVCDPFKFGYNCSLNYCYFLPSGDNCAGYFLPINRQTNHTLDAFGNIVEQNRTKCDGGILFGSTCYCDIGYNGYSCNSQSCLYYLQENQVCYTTLDNSIRIQALCNHTGQCICNNRSYYVQNQNYQSQTCAIGCPGLIHGICLSADNKAQCYPGYTNAVYRPGVNATNIKCIIDGCANKSDYEACTIFDNATENTSSFALSRFADNICYGGICVEYKELARCQESCRGGCMSYYYQLQCVQSCSENENTIPCLDMTCSNDCNGHGICNQPTTMPTKYQNDLLTPFIVGTCTCYDQNMIGFCDQCVSGFHIYRGNCLPDTCGGFLDAQSCQLRGGVVAGATAGVLILLLLIAGIIILVFFLLKRQRRINALQNQRSSLHLETLHYQI